jgi:glycosyltransferase involved in cell wall biosynthesis
MTNQFAPIKILALNWRCVRHPQAGGAEMNLFEQARRWVEDGHEVTVFCADPGRERAPKRDEVIDGIVVRRRGGRFTVYLWAAWFLLRHDRQFDRILDVGNGIPFFAPLFTSNPVVLLIHHVHARQWFTEFQYPFAFIGWLLERWGVPRIYRRTPVIAVSPTTRDGLVAIGIQPTQVHVVYNGIGVPSVSPKPCDPNHRIAYVGRIKRYKRLDRLVIALIALRHEFPDIHLDIAGDGDARLELEALVKRMNVAEHVTIHGYVDEFAKAEILRSASVFATPSMQEGWGLSVIEANTFGCPAVAYNVPGLQVAILHGKTGLLAEDDEAFRESIAALLRDVDLRERLGAAAIEWARRFSWEQCARQTLAIIYKGKAEKAPLRVPRGNEIA